MTAVTGARILLWLWDTYDTTIFIRERNARTATHPNPACCVIHTPIIRKSHCGFHTCTEPLSESVLPRVYWSGARRNDTPPSCAAFIQKRARRVFWIFDAGYMFHTYLMSAISEPPASSRTIRRNHTSNPAYYLQPDYLETGWNLAGRSPTAASYPMLGPPLPTRTPYGFSLPLDNELIFMTLHHPPT
ncbi:hypothetical protein BD779DRAFT_898601 [Infundibulicybe gibba]|nr:hypothetical protein BD779DRAFT_898601 [Infundibulicybe gibba]